MLIVAPVRNGKLELSLMQQEVFDNAVRKLEGQEAQLKIEKYQQPRSLTANRYLWGVVYLAIAAETGHATEELHEFFKNLFLPRSFVTVGGHEQQVAKSTTGLSADEFSDFIEQVKAFAAAELNISIPPAEHA